MAFEELTYTGRYVENCFLTPIQKKVRCTYYSICLQEQEVAAVYATFQLAILVIGDKTFRIDKNLRYFRKSTFPISNHYSNVQIGQFDRRKIKSKEHKSCKFVLPGGSSYLLWINSKNVKLFMPSTWLSSYFEMRDEQGQYWNFTGSQYEGGIGLYGTNNNLLAVCCAIFAIHELHESLKD